MKPLPAHHLRCEYLPNPLGIATLAPRFSWILEHPRRGARQAFYQVIVSPEEEFINKEVGDYWDSGRVESDRTSDVAYSGEPLWSGKRYFWSVRWWDENGEVSPYSEAAFFEMGLLQEKSWKAKWISQKKVSEFESKGSVLLGESSGKSVQNMAVYLRKEFETKRKIRRARAYICGLGYYELRLNGRKIGDHVLDPAQTDYRKTACYCTYDVSADLKQKNAVAVILGNGRHIKDYGYPPPRLLMELHLELENELVERILTDETWKTSSGPLLENGIYAGERYDARLEQPGWDEPGFDDSSWESAAVVQGTSLSPQITTPIRVADRLKPFKMWSPLPGVHIFDFGQNFSGWVRLRAEGPRGKEIKLRYAELVQEDGTLNVSTSQNAEATDTFILRGQGEETYEPRFTYHGFRYVEVGGYPRDPRLEDIEGCFVHTDVERTGTFECSNSLINKIHQNIVWSQLSNLMSIPTDCPQRDERHGWLGDAHLSAEEAILNFDMAVFYTKYLEDIRLSLKDDGSLPDVVPPYLGQLYPGDPAWTLAYLELVWLVYFHYDDERIIQKHYAGMKKHVDFLSENAEALIIKRLGKYGDWCPPGSILPKKTPLELTSTWCYYRAASLLSRFAGILSRRDDSKSYGKLAEDIKSAFNDKFLENDQYAALRISAADKSPNQTSNILPLYLDMVPHEKKSKVMERLLHNIVNEWDYHLDTGIIGARYLLDVLTEGGYGDVAYRIVSQKSYPGWGYMVEEGATTLWERWEKLSGRGMNSHNHVMLGSVDAWFYRTIAGIRPESPGWKRIVIRPPLLEDLRHASAALRTIRGKALTSWKREDNVFELVLCIPVGAEASVYIPLLWEKTRIKEEDVVLWGCQEAEARSDARVIKERESQYLTFTVGSGAYHFIAEKQ